MSRAFDACYEPDANSGCWLWSRATSGNGYGAYKGKMAHRHSLEVFTGEPIPPGLFVCHRCDTHACVNPDHLFLGTPKQNTADMIKKGRRVAPSTENRMRGSAWHAARPIIVSKGERHPQAKITEADVAAIRNSPLTGVAVAEIYEMSPLNVSRIRRRMTWKHVA